VVLARKKVWKRVSITRIAQHNKALQLTAR
jgi:hypothetical protein